MVILDETNSYRMRVKYDKVLSHNYSLYMPRQSHKLTNPDATGSAGWADTSPRQIIIFGFAHGQIFMECS